MKSKKALKRLNKVESLLSRVIDSCPASARGLRELLDSAKASVGRAMEVVNARVAQAARKPPARSTEFRQGPQRRGPKEDFACCEEAMGGSKAQESSRRDQPAVE